MAESPLVQCTMIVPVGQTGQMDHTTRLDRARQDGERHALRRYTAQCCRHCILTDHLVAQRVAIDLELDLGDDLGDDFSDDADNV